ncbi:ribosomal protein S18-alanine N-acetyltransferase [Tepidibacter thalassicus]|uniref:[Ribosomal protein bS18]-alanine N-acetyltransferase n=1 Tax=Tepidibacter thalassicus DSM 15285 TaxID=1123350 RepID=A0A1M5SC61_9FIRM|nr:ribosomal protein S18-alanine N-acetyltransferase [Tepidibacter thalassicus]SHH36202.1 [SSU ribosomal protein S18P]-alanine acetyltransferase [Tepidibacter thalassicus DSM 15285]
MGNNIDVRYLTKNDIDKIVELEKLCFVTPWTKGAFEQELKNKLARYIVIEKDNTIVAYGGIWLIVDEGHITNIAVHPDYRGIGLGNKIVNALIDECIKNDVTSMTLEVRKSNITAQNLYKKHGFEIAGIRPDYYKDTHEDALIMWKEINKGV